jgi:hypothetical protein
MDHSHGLLDTTPVLAHDGQNLRFCPSKKSRDWHVENGSPLFLKIAVKMEAAPVVSTVCGLLDSDAKWGRRLGTKFIQEAQMMMARVLKTKPGAKNW